MPNNMYEDLNSWIGNWNHPTEDVGKFIVRDNLKVAGDFEADGFIENSFSGEDSGTRIEYCKVGFSGAVVGGSGCGSWVTSVVASFAGTSNPSARPCRQFNFTLNSGIFSITPSCFANSPYTQGAFQDHTVYASSDSTTSIVVRSCNATTHSLAPTGVASLVCIGRR